MAGTIVHLAVATQLDQLFANEPERYLGKMADKYCSNDFFAGNICPDGIMAREGYCREMKLHTHMRDGIPDGTFRNRNIYSYFESVCRIFLQNIITKKNASVCI